MTADGVLHAGRTELLLLRHCRQQLPGHGPAPDPASGQVAATAGPVGLEGPTGLGGLSGVAHTGRA